MGMLCYDKGRRSTGGAVMFRPPAGAPSLRNDDGTRCVCEVSDNVTHGQHRALGDSMGR